MLECASASSTPDSVREPGRPVRRAARDETRELAGSASSSELSTRCASSSSSSSSSPLSRRRRLRPTPRPVPLLFTAPKIEFRTAPGAEAESCVVVLAYDWSCASHSKASRNPSPLRAEEPTQRHGRSRIEWRCIAASKSAAESAPARSCLLAATRSGTPRSSGALSTACSSLAASMSRRLSAPSMT
eukprot:scaffold110992_cov34-Tisochrysis_lutea.AAC.2